MYFVLSFGLVHCSVGVDCGLPGFDIRVSGAVLG